MKLVIAGGTGFVATELIRQCLRLPEVTTLVVLSRKPVTAEQSDSTKLKQVLIDDYGQYPAPIMKELEGADACIWTVAITPSKSKAYKFDEVKRICQTCTLAGLSALHEASPSTPLRFIYMSGKAAERDQSAKPSYAPEYSLMRGETETKILEFAHQHSKDVRACIIKPGLITSNVSITRAVWGAALRATNATYNISVQEVAAAMLSLAIHGFEKDTLENDELRKLGQGVLK